MRLGLAFKAFFRILSDAQAAEQVDRALSGTDAPAAPATLPPPTAQVPAAPRRNDAITLLATLQREARFVDLVKESLDEYSDAQVGAAARQVLRDCAQVLDRLFTLEPVVTQAEGTIVSTPASVDSGRYRLTGNVSGTGPYQGTLVHPGWQAQHCRLPQWQGTAESAMVVAPAEVEVSKQADPA